MPQKEYVNRKVKGTETIWEKVRAAGVDLRKCCGSFDRLTCAKCYTKFVTRPKREGQGEVTCEACGAMLYHVMEPNYLGKRAWFTFLFLSEVEVEKFLAGSKGG